MAVHFNKNDFPELFPFNSDLILFRSFSLQVTENSDFSDLGNTLDLNNSTWNKLDTELKRKEAILSILNESDEKSLIVHIVEQGYDRKKKDKIAATFSKSIKTASIYGIPFHDENSTLMRFTCTYKLKANEPAIGQVGIATQVGILDPIKSENQIDFYLTIGTRELTKYYTILDFELLKKFVLEFGKNEDSKEYRNPKSSNWKSIDQLHQEHTSQLDEKQLATIGIAPNHDLNQLFKLTMNIESYTHEISTLARFTKQFVDSPNLHHMDPDFAKKLTDKFNLLDLDTSLKDKDLLKQTIVYFKDLLNDKQDIYDTKNLFKSLKLHETQNTIDHHYSSILNNSILKN